MKNKLVVGGIVLALLLSGLAFFGIEDGRDGRPGRDGRGAVVPSVIEEDRSSMGNVGVSYRGQSIAQGTSTICAQRSPRFATSTLKSGLIRFDVSSSTATIVTIAKSTDRFATTSQIGEDYAIAADAQALIVASTTAATATGTPASVTLANAIFAPGEFVVVGLKGGDQEADGQHVATKLVPEGSCRFIFNES